MLVRIVGVKTYTDRHGKRRRYYRRKGCPAVPMDPDLTGNDLAAEVARLDALYKPYAMRAGTVILLIDAYKKTSEHWDGLRERTQKDYERVFDYLKPTYDQILANITPPVVAAARDAARDAHGFKFANQLLVTLKTLFAFGVEYGHMTSNPAEKISPVARPKNLPDANRPWRPKEAVEMLKAPIHIAAPMALAAYLGIREGDILKMSRAALSDRLLGFTTSKTRRMLELPVCDDLWAILLRYQAWRKALFSKLERDDEVLTMFVNSRGRPWTSDGFRTSFGKWRDELLKAGKIEEGVTFHGARHTVATILAEAGYEGEKVKHLLGHGAETITEYYARRAKRRGMLKDMSEVVQMAYRTAGENVIAFDQMRNESV